MAIDLVDDLAVTNLGAEKVTNGDFATSAGWTFGQASGGWSYDGTNDDADCDGNQTAGVDLEQDISAVASEKYAITYTVSNWVAGTVTPQIGGIDGIAREAGGTYGDYITATGTGNLKFQADSDFNGTIDTISVKKVLYPDGDTIYLTWTNPQAYIAITIYRSDDGGSSYDVIHNAEADDTSYEDTAFISNTKHYYKLLVEDADDTGYSNTDSAAIWADNITDEIAVSESITEYATGVDVSDTIIDTVYMSDFAVDATDIITNYAYYVATADGKVYEYSGFYKSDGGTAITAQWESKDTDFAEQDIQNSDKFKTVEFVRLHYMDKSAGALIDVRISTDGGANWTTKTKNIGTGDNKGKTKDFYFVETGQIFRFSVRSVSTSDEFQWAGIEVFYNIGGTYFEP